MRRLSREPARFGLERTNWERSLQEPTEFYLECLRFFCNELPPELKEHRSYFQTGGRGFGEDPFHVMWFLLAEYEKRFKFSGAGS